MAKILRADFKTRDGERKRLLYYIHPNNTVVDRWWELMKLSMNKDYKDIKAKYPEIKVLKEDDYKMELKTRLTNVGLNNVTFLMESINGVLTGINGVYDKDLPVFTDTNELDNEILNYLHEEFEVYGDRMQELKDKNIWTFDLHENFLALNEFIHMIETAMHGEENNFPNFSALSDFLPAGIFEPLVDDDMHFLGDTLNWGGLYTGYNTLGKDWLSIAPENDFEVIERDEVRPQERFSTETWFNFGPDMQDSLRESFYTWYKTLTPELQAKVPIGDLKALSLGRYKLGRIIIDETFLEYHPVLKDWYLPAGPSYNHVIGPDSVKKDWNNEVFSTFTDLVGMRMYEADLLVGFYDKELELDPNLAEHIL